MSMNKILASCSSERKISTDSLNDFGQVHFKDIPEEEFEESPVLRKTQTSNFMMEMIEPKGLNLKVKPVSNVQKYADLLEHIEAKHGK